MSGARRKTSLLREPAGAAGSKGAPSEAPEAPEAHYPPTNGSQLWTMAASQNLPALLNDPAKGKQRDFFTRSWGDSFVDSRAVPPSPFVCELPSNAFDRYLKKIRRHNQLHGRGNRNRRSQSPVQAAQSQAPGDGGQDLSPRSLAHQREAELTNNNWHKAGSHVSRVFMDPNFDLTKPETFAAIFQIDGSKSNFGQQVEEKGRLIQERLTHQLDQVEVSIAHQVAQKSHHFFQVMTYHDALMTQLTGLVKIVRALRKGLHSVDSETVKPSLELCRLKRRLSNSTKLLEKLQLLSFLHQTQPTIQLLLASSEFSGALDLITTSCDILAVDLEGVVALRHFTHQLQEMKGIIGKVLLNDFQTFISSEIGRETLHIKATSIEENRVWGAFDTDQLKSVIFGLLRQNSYTFLEALEDAGGGAIKSTMRDVIVNVRPPPKDKDITMTNLVLEFARQATSEEWLDLFDTLIGTLIGLLHRISVVSKVIREAIVEAGKEVTTGKSEAEAGGGANGQGVIAITEQQLETLLSTNREVLINICEQMTERVAKLLAQRSKPGAAEHISVQELTNLAFLVSVFARETSEKSSRQCSGLQLSLQSQTVMYVQNFHEERRNQLSTKLEKENWKKTNTDFEKVYAKLTAIPSLKALFEIKDEPVVPEAVSEEEESSKNGVESPPSEETNGINGGVSPAPSSASSRSTTPLPVTNQTSSQSHLGQFRLGSEAESFAVVASVPEFLKMLAEYCNLCSMLPNVSVELGLKTAELIKFLNSRICQLILGAGAISVAGLKTITIRNLALALRSLQLVIRVIPYVLLHFKDCYQERAAAYQLMSNGSASPQAPKAESKQFEILQRQFDQALKHLRNHADELQQKIISVVEAIVQQHVVAWQPPKHIPSSSFKSLCKQLTKLHESTSDVWSPSQTRLLFTEVHRRLLAAVAGLIKERGLKWEEGGAKASQSRALLSEMVFYGQSLMRLGVLENKELEMERFEGLWQ